MNRNFNIINPEAFIKAFEDMNCGKTHIAQISSEDFEIKQEETQPLEGYEVPKGFPNCCEKHKAIVRIGAERFAEFPNCCSGHRKLNNAKWFSKANYSYLPVKLVNTLSFTWHCIAKCIDNPDWYKEITDYIEYTKSSYGQFPHGYGAPLGAELYLYNLEKNIEAEEEIPADKKEKLLSFIRKYSEPVTEVEQTDINLLISKYKEWLKIFPFEISFFKNLKPYFENQMPILTGKGETNIYTGLTGFKVKTKKELIGFLVSITLAIIKEVNTKFLYENNLLKDANEFKIELVLAKRKIELGELDKTDLNDRKDYIKLLKKWLSGEKSFLTELRPLVLLKENSPDFTGDLIDGIKKIQQNGTNEECIRNIIDDKPNKETAFRYWFKNFFSARYPEANVTAEEEKGNGRIDLKVTHKQFGDKIVEFKGWWNSDKKEAAEQAISYLTDFEFCGYIFMINHLKTKNIVADYKNLIIKEEMKYIPGSWIEKKVPNTDYCYYESKHQFGAKEKILYHFIFNVFC